MSVAAPQDEGVYARSLCTGLGDRLGMLLALAAVARAYNLTRVTMGWCVDPVGAFRNNPMHMHHIPGWTGYDYPLATLRERLHARPDRKTNRRPSAASYAIGVLAPRAPTCGCG